MESKIDKEILFDYFANKATPLQKEQIENWYRSKSQNRDFFFLWLEQWELKNAKYNFDTGAELKRLKSRIENYNLKSSEIKMPYRTGLRAFFCSWQVSAAVAVLLLLSVTVYLLGESSSPQIMYHTDYGEMRSITLTDGSTVRLNGNSRLKVMDGFEGLGPREVWLEGEAFFTVIHTPDDRGFIVHTGDVRVEVLGTEFNVKDRNEATQVVLNSGKVKLYLDVKGDELSSDEIIMVPGDMVEFTELSNALTKRRVNTKIHTSWRNGEFIFESTPLRDIIKVLEENYGLIIKVEDVGLKDVEFTAILPADNAEVLLKALEKSFEFEVKQENGVVTLIRNKN